MEIYSNDNIGEVIATTVHYMEKMDKAFTLIALKRLVQKNFLTMRVKHKPLINYRQ